MPPEIEAKALGHVSLELQKRLEAWRKEPNVVSASELVETAIVEGAEVEAIVPAQLLTAPDSRATPLVKRQAAILLERIERVGKLQPKAASNSLSVRSARSRTRRFPHEAYAWVDLALAHTICGRNSEAERSIRVAIQLAPFDRHVLRSAARLYLHLNDEEHAHDLLRNNGATKHDPWLMAAEIAISGLAGRNPTMFNGGRNLLEDGDLLPKHASELASAIATVHLRDGNRKARRFFNASLVDPTGNSLAQAEWASPHIANLVKPQTLTRAQDSAEAEVYQAYWAADFREAIRQCEIWKAEEPFSSRPYQFGSGVAITIEDFQTALEFADAGLRLNNEAVILHNNRAYSLVALGRSEEALSTITYCLRKYPEDSLGALIATSGMFALRLGQLEEGVQQYKKAILHFKRSGNQISEALAMSYFAQEAARAGLSEAQAIFQEATNAFKHLRHVPEKQVVLTRAEAWLSATAQRNALPPLAHR